MIMDCELCAKIIKGDYVSIEADRSDCCEHCQRTRVAFHPKCFKKYSVELATFNES